MDKKEEISISVIKRLPRYYRFLQSLKENGIIRISSKELANRMGLTASQIRHDFNCFGGFGQQGYGYNVPELHSKIGEILGVGIERKTILIGAGNLGKAVCNNNLSVLYEQQTENLYGIVLELKKEGKYTGIVQQMSERKIAQSMEVLDGLADECPKYEVQIDKKPELKELQKRYLLSERKKMLQIQQRNQINARRIENAVKFKG